MLAGLALAVVLSGSETIVLWPDGNPGGWARPEAESSTRDGVLRIANVSRPTLTYFPPAGNNAKDAAVIVSPGGGYRILAIEHEGSDVAKLLASRGYHAFVLKYRLPRKGDVRHTAALEDSLRAVEIVRSRAEGWGISSNKIGMMGFSAGGHLTAVTAAPYGRRTFKPYDDSSQSDCSLNFVGLIYPAYLVDSKTNVISPEVELSQSSVPTFIVQTTDDPVRVENSLYYFNHLKEKKGDGELHIFPDGRHGYGLRAKDKAVGAWPDLFITWLDRITR